MILEFPFPPDIRVEKEAKVLTNVGYDVYVMAMQNAHALREETFRGYTIHRFNPKDYRFLKNLSRDYRQLRFIDPLWKKGIETFVRTYNIDVLHVHDLPLVRTALFVARKNNIPIVADYHENFPAQIQALNPPNLSRRKRFYRSYKRWSAYEGAISHQVDQIIVVVQAYKNHLIEKHRIPGEKITIVQNTVDIDILKNVTQEKPPQNAFIISYIGSFGPHRGLDVVIRAMPEILSHIPVAKFIVAGKGKNQSELENLAKELNVSSSVEFLGWKEYSEIPYYFKNAHVGVIPHRASEHTDFAVPNKLFEYMYFSVPVVTSDRPSLKMIIEETNAGLVFKTDDPSDFAEKILRIYHNSEGYGKNGYQAVMKKYNWNVDKEWLVNLYRTIALKNS